MTIEDAASALLILLPIAFNAFFFLLARLFDYPAILRSPTASILSGYRSPLELRPPATGRAVGGRRVDEEHTRHGDLYG